MDFSHIPLDAPTLRLGLSITGGLLLISMVRIMFLLRTNERLRDCTSKMEQQVLHQHHEILSARSDSNAWHGELQRMFDAFRAEFSRRIADSEQRYQDLQRRIAAADVPPAASIPPPPAPAAAASAPAEEKKVLPVPALNII